jgi:hypothetical protein
MHQPYAAAQTGGEMVASPAYLQQALGQEGQHWSLCHASKISAHGMAELCGSPAVHSLTKLMGLSGLQGL